MIIISSDPHYHKLGQNHRFLHGDCMASGSPLCLPFPNLPPSHHQLVISQSEMGLVATLITKDM